MCPDGRTDKLAKVSGEVGNVRWPTFSADTTSGTTSVSIALWLALYLYETHTLFVNAVNVNWSCWSTNLLVCVVNGCKCVFVQACDDVRVPVCTTKCNGMDK